MGRRSNLTDKQWDEVLSRIIRGEKAADLAKEYKVSKSAVCMHISKRAESIKTVAKQVVAADVAFSQLPMFEKIETLSLINELKAISLHMGGAAKFQSMTAHRISKMANDQVDKIDEINPLNSEDILQGISALTRIANDASQIPFGLLNANKEMVKDFNKQSDAPKLKGIRIIKAVV